MSIDRSIWANVTTAHAIASGFDKSGAQDPWSGKLRGEFADIFIMGDHVSYPLPVKEGSPPLLEVGP